MCQLSHSSWRCGLKVFFVFFFNFLLSLTPPESSCVLEPHAHDLPSNRSLSLLVRLYLLRPRRRMVALVCLKKKSPQGLVAISVAVAVAVSMPSSKVFLTVPFPKVLSHAFLKGLGRSHNAFVEGLLPREVFCRSQDQ